MLALHFRQVAEQFPGGCVGHPLLGLLIKLAGFQFHDLGLLAHDIDTQRPHQPYRAPANKALHIVAADQRDMVAKPLLVYVDQSAAMSVLLLLHLLEHFGRGRIALAQAIHEVAVDAAVFLLQRNGQRQDFLLGQFFEILRHAVSKFCYGYIDG